MKDFIEQHVKDCVFEAINEWMQENNEEKLKNDFKEILNKEKKEILCAILGIDTRLGRVSRSELLGEMVKDIAIEAAVEFIKDIEFPKPTKLMQDTLRRMFNERFKEQVYRMASSVIEQKVKEQVAHISLMPKILKGEKSDD